MNDGEVIELALKWAEEIKTQVKNDKKVVENDCYPELMGVLSAELFASNLIASLNLIVSKEAREKTIEAIFSLLLLKIDNGLK